MKGTTTTTTVNGYLRLRRVAGCMNSNNKKLIGCSFIGAFIYAFIRYSLRFVSFRVVSAVFAIYMANNIRKCLLIDSPVFSSTCDRAYTHTHTHLPRPPPPTAAPPSVPPPSVPLACLHVPICTYAAIAGREMDCETSWGMRHTIVLVRCTVGRQRVIIN